MLEKVSLFFRNISLVSLRAEDAHKLFKLTDRNRAYLRQWLPWLDLTTKETDTINFIENTIEAGKKDKSVTLGIWRDEELLGIVGFNSIDKFSRKAIVGYWLGEEYQGQGIMSDACSELIKFGFEVLKLHRIEIHCATENTKSCNIPVQLGFSKEGTLREAEWLYDHFVSHNVYSILENEWRSRCEKVYE